MPPQNKLSFKKGFASIYITVLILAFVLSIGSSAIFLTLNQQRMSQNIIKSGQAYYAAEAGVEDAVYRLKNLMTVSANYSLAVGQGTVQVAISGADTKTIDSSGAVQNATRKVRAILSRETINPQFFYGVQVGEGGLEMENNTTVIGNLYSDGSIQGTSNSVVTGDITVATGSTLGEKSLVQNQDQVFGKVSPVLDLAQQISLNATGDLVQVSLYLKKVGDPSNVVVRILTDSGDAPTKTVLASATLNASGVGTSYSWTPVGFSSPATLTAGNKYWIMIDTADNKNHYWTWGSDSNNGYGNGIAKYSANWSVASPVWSSPLVGDLAFKTFMGGQITSISNVTVKGTARANTIINSQICGDAYYQSIDAFSLSFLS
ncbi:MAG: pilus assembly PilX N-terminal domain-containing protein, partial [Patescibacteria group bacterium]